MIVNINQCASNYDETLHVMKFSAVAKQVRRHSLQLLNPLSLCTDAVGITKVKRH